MRDASHWLRFGAWLTEHGAEVLAPTSEWEAARFRSHGGQLSIVYRNKQEILTYTGLAEAAHRAFRFAKPWSAGAATKRRHMGGIIPTIRKRDGDLCFFCQREVSEEDESKEHLVSLAHGGPNHISNLFLAHKTCNTEAGHLSAPEKIATHVRAALAQRGE